MHRVAPVHETRALGTLECMANVHQFAVLAHGDSYNLTNCTMYTKIKVAEDLSYVVLLRKKFAYLESIPGVLLPHPSSSGIPISVPQEHWSPYSGLAPPTPAASPMELYDQYLSQQAMRITPSMSSLEALLSKLPSVGPPAAASSGPASPFGYYEMPMLMPSSSVHQRPAVAKEEMVDAEEYGSSSMSTYYVNGE